MKLAHRTIAAAMLAAALSANTGPALAAGDGEGSSTGIDAVADLLFVKPIMALRTAIGAGIFLVTAPFTLAEGNIEEVANDLVTEPALELFSPLGSSHSENDH